MLQTATDLRTYYASPGVMTDPQPYASLFDGLPAELPELVKVVQGLLVHIFWAERYGLTLSEARKEEVQLRRVDYQLARILELDDRPLVEARPLEQKLVGNCRDFSVMLCAMLRHQGVPARARCGFGTYFLPGHYEDHWVCEYWNADESRWVLVDAQLDNFQQKELNVQFDPLDVPRDQFVVGGQAWQMCCTGGADPEKFGIFEWHGIWFVRGNLIRDFLSFNKIEILPWDGGWGYLQHETDLEAELMDHLATLTLAGDAAFAEIRTTYEQNNRFHIPAEWRH
jgi:hypothetical protein